MINVALSMDSATTEIPATFPSRLRESIDRLVHWVESHRFEAYDPGDGTNSFLRVFTFNQLLLERLLQQAVYRAPFNLRPVLGIRPHTSTKGMGYMAWGYLKMWKATGDERFKKQARHCLGWLIENRSPAFRDFAWGNHFSFSSRAGKIPKGEPTIVWSSLIGQAFVDAGEVLQDQQYLDVAKSIASWVLSLPREHTDSGDCLSYVAFKQSSIHNSNMLGGALLARVAAHTNNGTMMEVARQSMLYSCSRIRTDGSWYYGEESMYHWIDNFHTGYNLDSLRRYRDASGDASFNDVLERGFVYLQQNFFESDGCPKYYHNQRYPIDIQCAAQAVDTLTNFSDLHPESLKIAIKVAEWTITHMQDADGHFYYRNLGWATNRTPMLHWGLGTSFKALASLNLRLTQIAAAGRNSAASAR